MESWFVQIGAALTFVVGWFVRLEARLIGKLDIKEHTAICERQNDILSTELREIKGMITVGDNARALLKSDIQDQLHDIRLSLVTISKDNPPVKRRHRATS